MIPTGARKEFEFIPTMGLQDLGISVVDLLLVLWWRMTVKNWIEL